MILYDQLADWFHLLTAPADYAHEAALYRETLQRAIAQPRTLLELGSGGGNNASHLKRDFTCTLTDLSPGMLALSRTINPECERLRRTFDAVLVHDAVCYMTSQEDLTRAIETAFIHTRPGGATLFVPDCVAETLIPSTDTGGHDGDGRSLRYLEWTWDPDPTDTTYLVDYAYLLREGTDVRVLHDRHIEGVFPRATWLTLLDRAGFRATSQLGDGDPEKPGELFLALRPA